VGYRADDLWVGAQERQDLWPLTGRQTQGHTGVVSE
jgi:hypothetical protein